ncbi:MAG: hypothetical protein ACRD2T_00875, partial [Thermoanaerobaculia bacterium]
MLPALILAALLAAAPAARAQEPLSEEDVIAGTMQIDFATRSSQDTSGELKEGSSALGVQDKYSFTLNVGKT